MTMIYNMSAGFLVTYIESKGSKGTGVSMEEIFKRLSVEMGGDGKSITKQQLDEYIEKAEAGEIQVDNSKLKALKRIQDNWDTIANGKDSITFADMKNYYILLAATMTGNFTKTEVEDESSSMKDDIIDYLQEQYGLNSKDEIKKSHLEDFLNNLLTQKDKTIVSDSNLESALIDTVTNMIASHTKTSTVETEV